MPGGEPRQTHAIPRYPGKQAGLLLCRDSCRYYSSTVTVLCRQAGQTTAPARAFLFLALCLVLPLLPSIFLSPHLAKCLASPSDFLILASHRLTSHTNLPKYCAPRPTPGTQKGVLTSFEDASTVTQHLPDYACTHMAHMLHAQLSDCLNQSRVLTRQLILILLISSWSNSLLGTKVLQA